MEIDEWVRTQVSDLPCSSSDPDVEYYDYIMAKMGVEGYC